MKFFNMWTVVLAMLAPLLSSQSLAQWKQTNGPYGGSSSSAVFRIGTLGSVVLAGTSDKGVYRSTDKGVTWQASSTGMTDSAVSVFIASGAEVLAGSYGGDLFVSTDHGGHWISLGSFSGVPSGIYGLAATGANIFVGTTRGVSISTNSGQTWTSSNIGLPSFAGSDRSIASLAIVNNVIFAGVEPGGVYVSTDNGLTWTLSGLSGLSVFAFAVKGTSIFAAVPNGVYLSTDTGSNWTRVNNNLEDTSVTCLGLCGQKLLVGTVRGIFASTDDGESWKSSSAGLTDAGVWALASNDPDIYAAGMGGVFHSTDSGESWAPINNGLIIASVNDIMAKGDLLFASSNYNGVFVSRNGGDAWDNTIPGLTTTGQVFFAHDTSDVFVAGGGGVFLSTNDGKSWKNVWSLPVTSLAEIVWFDTTRVIIGSSGSIYLSSDTGKTWSARNGGMDFSSINSLSFGSTSHGIKMYCGRGFGLFVSTDLGTTWKGTGFSGLVVSSISVVGTEVFAAVREPVWVGRTAHHNVASGDAGLFVSFDFGASWTASDSGIAEGASIRAIVAYGHDIIAGGLGDGALVSSDSGKTWTASNDGLGDRGVTSLALSGEYLFAGTQNNGVWKRPLSGIVTSARLGPITIPGGFSLEQNYPNPFNPTTTIRYGLSGRSHVTLTVFNTLGQAVTTLVNETRDAGYHEVRFDASDLASGVYFYRLQAGSFVQTKKLVILR